MTSIPNASQKQPIKRWKAGVHYPSSHLLTLENCPPDLWAKISPDLELQGLEEGIGVHMEKPTGILEFGTGSQGESVTF